MESVITENATIGTVQINIAAYSCRVNLTWPIKSEKIKKMVDDKIDLDDQNKSHNWKINLQFLFYLGMFIL